MLQTHLLAALIAALVAGWSAWSVRSWKADADAAQLVAAHTAAEAAQRAQADAAAARHEAERARVERSRRVITKEVDRVVERPVYRDGLCLDADGLRLVAAAVAGTDRPGQPAPAVPAVGAAE